VRTHAGCWRQYAPLKRRSTIVLHGSITQKTVLNIDYTCRYRKQIMCTSASKNSVLVNAYNLVIPLTFVHLQTTPLSNDCRNKDIQIACNTLFSLHALHVSRRCCLIIQALRFSGSYRAGVAQGRDENSITDSLVPKYIGAADSITHLVSLLGVLCVMFNVTSSGRNRDSRCLRAGCWGEHLYRMKFRVFWDVAPCSQVEVDLCFRGAYCLHHQGDKSSPS
jgi:hypothetical protein